MTCYVTCCWKVVAVLVASSTKFAYLCVRRDMTFTKPTDPGSLGLIFQELVHLNGERLGLWWGSFNIGGPTLDWDRWVTMLQLMSNVHLGIVRLREIKCVLPNIEAETRLTFTEWHMSMCHKGGSGLRGSEDVSNPPFPQGAYAQQLVVKGNGPKRRWPPKVPRRRKLPDVHTHHKDYPGCLSWGDGF